jgi:hypothetical protein
MHAGHRHQEVSFDFLLDPVGGESEFFGDPGPDHRGAIILRGGSEFVRAGCKAWAAARRTPGTLSGPSTLS